MQSERGGEDGSVGRGLPAQGFLSHIFPEHSGQYIDDTAEIETKALALGGEEDFARLVQMLRERGALAGVMWDKSLYSSYQDTPDLAIHEARECLRVRYECGGVPGAVLEPDISTKDFGEAFGHGIRRIELEASLRRGLELDINPLFSAFSDNPQAIRYLRRLAGLFGNETSNLREIVFIECGRTNLNTELFICEGANGAKEVRLRPDLNGCAASVKRAVFEFSLDECHYYVPLGDTGQMVAIGKDYEIEFELKIKPCIYSRDKIGSDPGLTSDEAYLAQEYIVSELLKKAVPAENLIFTCPSKQVRAYERRRLFEAEYGPIALPTRPTICARPVASVPILPLHIPAAAESAPAQVQGQNSPQPLP